MRFPRSIPWLALIFLVASTVTCSEDLATPTEPTTIKLASGDGQTAAVNTLLPVPLVVSVTDADGKPVPGVTVNWTAAGGGNVSSTSVQTDGKGHASVRRTLGPTVGPQTTTATVASLDGSPVAFMATAGAVGSESMAITMQPPTSVLDREIFAPTDQPAVKVLDATGNPLQNREISASIESGGGTLQGSTTARTNASGVAAFNDLGIAGTGAQKLKFTSGGLSVASPTIAVTPLSQAATTGSWGPVITWPIVPLHMHLLPTGNILAWGRRGVPHVWHPPADADPAAAGSFTEVPVDVDSMLFCSGHAFMPDGRLMVAGGHLTDDNGQSFTHFFTPDGNAGHWDNAGGARMVAGRWYPTVTILPNGRVFTMAGRAADTVVHIAELWDGTRWIQLKGINQRFPYYPRDFLAPDGRVFYAGERVTSWYLDVNAVVNGQRGTMTASALHKWRFNRDYGSAVMYDDGKILYVGGGGDPNSNNPKDATSPAPTNTAEIIDLNDGSPSWAYTDPMQFPRRHLNATVLPDKQVLVTGGVSGGGFNDLSIPTRAAELWNPATGHWTTLAASARPRGYHAVSILLPSGQVLHGASGDANVPVGLPGAGVAYPRETNHEIFSPPYLFKGNRPTFTSAPATVGYGQTFSITTPYAAQITKVTWIRLPSATHAFDANQRLGTLSFSRTIDGLNVTTPADPNLAPPGHYMLFVMNRNGVPSVGRIIRVG